MTIYCVVKLDWNTDNLLDIYGIYKDKNDAEKKYMEICREKYNEDESPKYFYDIKKIELKV